MTKYEELKHQLDTKLLRASSLSGEQEQQKFVAETFVEIHKQYKDKFVNHDGYLKLINRLATYQRGRFNDYVDMLAGAAQFNMLDMAVQSGLPQFSPESARQRRDMITDLTGVEPVEPDQEGE